MAKKNNDSLYNLLQSILEDDLVKSAVDDPGSSHPIADEDGGEQDVVHGEHYEENEPTNFEEQLGNTLNAPQNEGGEGDEIIGTQNPSQTGEDVPDTEDDIHETQDTSHPANVKNTKQSAVKVASLISQAYKALYDVVEQVNTIFTTPTNAALDTTKIANTPTDQINAFDSTLSNTFTDFSKNANQFNQQTQTRVSQGETEQVTALDRQIAYTFTTDLIKSAEVDANLVGTWLKKMMKKHAADEEDKPKPDDAGNELPEGTDTTIPASDVSGEVPDDVIQKLLDDLNKNLPTAGEGLEEEEKPFDLSKDLEGTANEVAGDFAAKLDELGVPEHDVLDMAAEGLKESPEIGPGLKGEEEDLEKVEDVRSQSDVEAERETGSESKAESEKTSSLKKQLKKAIYTKLAAYALKKMVSKNAKTKTSKSGKKAQTKLTSDVWEEIAKYLSELNK
jgi:hypothetical protein